MRLTSYEMARRWVLDTDTKETGARLVPLEDLLAKPEPKARPKGGRTTTVPISSISRN